MKYITEILIVAAAIAVGIVIVDAQINDDPSELYDGSLVNPMNSVARSEVLSALLRSKRQESENHDQHVPRSQEPPAPHRAKREMNFNFNGTMPSSEDVKKLMNQSMIEGEKLFNTAVKGIEDMFNKTFPRP